MVNVECVEKQTQFFLGHFVPSLIHRRVQLRKRDAATAVGVHGGEEVVQVGEVGRVEARGDDVQGQLAKVTPAGKATAAGQKAVERCWAQVGCHQAAHEALCRNR